MINVLIILVVLIVLEVLFLKSANSFGLMDMPNERSSHQRPTIRGAGFVIGLSLMLSLLLFDIEGRWYLSGGSLLIFATGFYDDTKGSSPLVRTIFQSIATLLMIYGLGLFDTQLPIMLALILIVSVGTINAVNFMDGINGISALYGLLMLSCYIYLNSKVSYLPMEFIVSSGLGLIVFGAINIRKRALAFAGDVGSTGLGYLLILFTVLWMFKESSLVYFLFWAVYGVDSTLTIVERIIKRQNIFGAHRSHLYQLLSNELNWGHLKVGFVYVGVQVLINCVALYLILNKTPDSWWITVVLLLFLGVVYMVIKQQVKSRVKQSSTS